MADRFESVIGRIQSLLTALNDGSGVAPRARIESTLTEGYAAALALDGERLRLERRIDEVTAHVAEGGSLRVTELQQVMGRLEETEQDLAELRDLLVRLKARAAAAA